MKTSKKLRISGFKDYIAVDVVDEQEKIIETPFYLKKGETKTILYQDQEDGKWRKTEAKISEDFTKLLLKDSEMDYDCDIQELTEPHIKFK